MNLEKLSIENFQSIKKMEVDFGKFTVLVGRSNSGKSAILRALHVLVRNSFQPSYVRQGTTNTVVTATFTDGGITTKRGKESTYILSKETDETYTKCGRAVPDAVAQFLRLPLLSDEDLNFTNQFELPFLVGGKSSRASAVVGTITNAVMVNSLAQETNRRRLGFLQKTGVREGDLKALQEDLEAYAHLPTLESALEQLQSLESSLDGMKTTAFQLQEWVDEVASTRARMVPLPKLPDIDPAVFVKLQKLEKGRSWVEGFLERVTQITQNKVRLPVLPAFDTDKLDRLDTYRTDAAGLQKMILDWERAQSSAETAAGLVAQLSADVVELRKELDNTPVCEACGQPILGD